MCGISSDQTLDLIEIRFSEFWKQNLTGVRERAKLPKPFQCGGCLKFPTDNIFRMAKHIKTNDINRKLAKIYTNSIQQPCFCHHY